MSDYVHDHPEHVEVEATPVEARGGDRKTWSTRILIISTLAAAVGLFIYFGIYAAPAAPM